MIISLNGGEGQNAQSAYEYRRLREILTRYPAFDAAMHDQKAKGDTAEGPGQTEISLKQDHRVPKAFFFGLVRLKEGHFFLHDVQRKLNIVCYRVLKKILYVCTMILLRTID